MHRRIVLLVCAFIASQFSPGAAMADGWRGPKRDGHASEFHPPQQWPQDLKRRWRLEVGVGHASPVVAAEGIYQFSRQNDQEVLRCLDLSGKEVWKQSYDAPYEMNNAARGHGKGPKSTPWVGNERIYTLGIDGVFQCRNRADGKLLWQADKALPSGSPLYGAAASPLVAGGKLCLIHLGHHNDGAMVAFDAAAGKVAWKWGEDGPAYTSPVIMKLGDVPQLVTQSQRLCLSFAADGALLWKIPFKTGYDQNIVTPVQFKDTVIFSGYQKGVTAVRPKLQADKTWTADEVWHIDDVSMYMSSPVLIGDRLYGFSEKRKGQLFCLNAATGETIWLGPPRQGDNAALVVAGQHIAALLTDGRLVIVNGGGGEYEPLAEYQLADSPTWAHPAMFDKNILVKDDNSLILWSLE